MGVNSCQHGCQRVSPWVSTLVSMGVNMHTLLCVFLRGGDRGRLRGEMAPQNPFQLLQFLLKYVSMETPRQACA